VPDTRRRSETRREDLLVAAVRVFAEKGYHSCRVSDIAAEAGVSHGLVYHYFASKDEVLETIFRENWGVVAQAIEEISETGDSAAEKLRKIAAVTLHAWVRGPEVVSVIVREVSRSPQLQERIGEFARAFDGLERVIREGQASGEIDRELDPRFATYAVWGMLDEVLTGWVLGRLPDEPSDIERAVTTMTAMIRRALAR
jgi:TetR/AcrR family transcriptional regulator, fatty acid metabolism regulator protein